MKFLAVVFSLLPFLSAVSADNHGACACQVGSDRALVDTDTETCCPKFGGKTAYFDEGGKVYYQGIYCIAESISGNDWHDCCTSQGSGDSACPW